MMLSTMLKSTAAAGMLGLGALLASATGAAAHFTTTRCDSDGDRCWTVRCEDDGDDCRRVSSYNGYDSYHRYNYGSRSGYYSGSSYGNRDGYWRCDRGGEDCHWIRYNSYYGGDRRDSDDRERY